MVLDHLNAQEKFLEELMADFYLSLKKDFSNVDKLDPKVFGRFTAQAVKSKFIVTCKEKNKPEMLKILKERGRI